MNYCHNVWQYAALRPGGRVSKIPQEFGEHVNVKNKASITLQQRPLYPGSFAA